MAGEYAYTDGTPETSHCNLAEFKTLCVPHLSKYSVFLTCYLIELAFQDNSVIFFSNGFSVNRQFAFNSYFNYESGFKGKTCARETATGSCRRHCRSTILSGLIPHSCFFLFCHF